MENDEKEKKKASMKIVTFNDHNYLKEKISACCGLQLQWRSLAYCGYQNTPQQLWQHSTKTHYYSQI